jgi:hypothetical protein
VKRPFPRVFLTEGQGFGTDCLAVLVFLGWLYPAIASVAITYVQGNFAAPQAPENHRQCEVHKCADRRRPNSPW